MICHFSMCFLVLCKKLVDEARLENVTLICANAERLPLDSGSVDFIHSNNVVEHVSNKAAMFRETSRVLADDGGKLRLEWREHGTRTGLLPGLQPAAAQFVTRATEQQTHESARVLWRKAQRSAMPHAGQAGLRALHT